MPVTNVASDPENLTLTVTADFTAPVERLWAAHVDPRQLERFWGPPGYPATFTRHDVTPGGRSSYFMSGPEGRRFDGRWEFLGVEPGRAFEVVDSLAHADGSPNTDLPTTRITFRFDPTGQGSRLVTTTCLDSLEDMEQLVAMGMDEGIVEAFGQIDQVLADLASFHATEITQSQLLGDTQVRISRVIAGPLDQVWRAHHEEELVRQWMLGPDGWRMSECRLPQQVGDSFRYAWEPVEPGTGEAFAFTGELVEQHPQYREVTTEAMEGMPGDPTLNELGFLPVDGGTLLTLVVTYASAEMRETVLATGMVSGMEDSYARMEALLR